MTDDELVTTIYNRVLAELEYSDKVSTLINNTAKSLCADADSKHRELVERIAHLETRLSERLEAVEQKIEPLDQTAGFAKLAAELNKKSEPLP